MKLCNIKTKMINLPVTVYPNERTGPHITEGEQYIRTTCNGE